MKTFSLFLGLGVFVCLSVGGRWESCKRLLAQQIEKKGYNENKPYNSDVLFDEQHCELVFSAIVFYLFVTMEFPCLAFVPLVLINYLSFGVSKFKPQINSN